MAKHKEEHTGSSTATLEPPPPHAMHNPFHHQQQDAPQEPPPPSPPPQPGQTATLPAQPTQQVWTPPKPLGKTPTGAGSLGAPAGIGTKATHFSGPIVSGGVPQQSLLNHPGMPAMQTPVAGSAILTTTLMIDYSMKNFTIPLQFPAGSIIVGVGQVTYVAFTAAPSFQLGKTSGASDIIPATAMPAPAAPVTYVPTTGRLPDWTAVAPQVPFQGYLTITANTANTAGLGFILIQFIRIPQKWN